MARTKVTLLGTTKSGKTSFIYGLHAIMQGGVDGFMINCKDPDDELDLINGWDRFLDTGEFFEATRPGDFVNYEFTLFDGAKPVLDIDFVDYRGGALDERSDDADNRQLVTHLADSDLVVVLLDSSLLVDPLAARGMRTRRNSRADRIQGYLQRLISERHEPPPIAILLTKADQLTQRKIDGDLHELFKEVSEDVRALLPIAFVEGSLTMVCPVSLLRRRPGYDNEPANVDPDDIDPRWMDKVLVFALFSFFLAEAGRAADSRRQSKDAQEEATAELSTISESFLGRMRFGRRAELNERINDARTEVIQSERRSKQLSHRAERLFFRLDGVPLYQDGEPMSDEV